MVQLYRHRKGISIYDDGGYLPFSKDMYSLSFLQAWSFPANSKSVMSYCTYISTIDKLYSQIGKVFRPWELNLLLHCFELSAMNSRISWNSWLSLPAWHTYINSGTGTALYGRGQLGSIWDKKRHPPPLFLSRCAYSMISTEGCIGNRILQTGLKNSQLVRKLWWYHLWAQSILFHPKYSLLLTKCRTEIFTF